jgi:hypothetical protein
MTSFVHIDHPSQHPGVVRFESAIDNVRQARSGFSGTRGLAAFLLSAVAAAVLVVAYQVMDTVAEGHMLVIWIGMWAAAFAVLALLAPSAQRSAARLSTGLDGWSRGIAEKRADARLWKLAQSDSRVMADLQAASTRYEALDDAALTFQAPAATAAPRATIATPGRKDNAALPIDQHATARKVRMARKYLRDYQRNAV